MRAEIAERQRAEDRVDDRVEQHIGIGVTGKPAFVRDRDPADHKRATFDQCVDTGKSTARIRKDIAEAQKVQASGTPTFFVGLTDSNGTQVKGARLVGAQPYQTFKDAIDRLLSSPK